LNLKDSSNYLIASQGYIKDVTKVDEVDQSNHSQTKSDEPDHMTPGSGWGLIGADGSEDGFGVIGIDNSDISTNSNQGRSL
jgi:hypothetical protein